MLSEVRCAPSSLTRGLIDDAAIFPPGLAPLDSAVARHRALRRSAFAPYIGPLLLRASWWRQFVALGSAADDVEVVLICRPGDNPSDIAAAVRGLAERIGPGQTERPSRLRGIELPWAGGEAARITETLAAELGPDFLAAFEIDGAAPDVDLAAVARQGGVRGGPVGERRPADARDGARGYRVLAKFRTGGIGPEDSPPADRLAGVIAEATRQQVPVKFTAGLHHAVTGPHGPAGSTQYGVLNVIAAVRQAISLTRENGYDAALVPSLSRTLMRTDATSLAAEAISLQGSDADAIRTVFVSFGCCGVTEPLAELAHLGVIPELPEGPQS
jgi:hypothetical protein